MVAKRNCFRIFLLFFFILITIAHLPSDVAKNSQEGEELRDQNNPNFRLKLEELDFEPACEIKSEDAISAINRAKTQSCKQQIANTTCLIQAGNYYPEELPNYCALDTNQYGRHLGCYVDETDMKLLRSFGDDVNPLTACLDICLQSGFPYAGIKYATECFCSDVAPSSSSKGPHEPCDLKCHAANPFKIVGGNFTLNVYETGLTKFVWRTPSEIPDYQESVRIVFLLTLNGRALRQIYRLINSIYRSNHYFYIHVDSRKNYLHAKLSALEKQFPNIKIASRRFPTIWAGTSFLQMILASMKEFFTLGWQWDFVINLSESTFPVKSLEKLESFLSANKGLSFVWSDNSDIQEFIEYQAVDKTFIECEGRMWRIGKRKIPRGIVIDGGSDWVTLSSEFVTYILGKQDKLLAGLEIIYKHTIFAPETFFAIVLRNSYFCNTYVSNHLHFVNWKRELGCQCSYKVVDWCGCSPNNFRIEDWPSIQNTQDKVVFFARKFEPIINQEIITKLEKYIGFNDHHLIPNLEAYWQNFYDTNDFTSSTDDILLTHARSIARYNAKILRNEDCHLEPGKIIEINSYHYADIYKGNLILHKAFIDNATEILIETWYGPKKHFELNFENQYQHCPYVEIFQVNSDYDEKETTFRNLGNILGPFSEPVLLYQFSPPIDKNFVNLKVIWLDPAGVIADVVEIYVDDNNLSNIIHPNLKTPLLPGVWKVGLFEKSNQILSTKFLITPLEYFSGKKLSRQKASEIHSGSVYSDKNYSDVKTLHFLPNKKDSVLLKIKSYSNAKRIDQDLKVWIDNLSIEFYDILGSCIASEVDIKDKITCGRHKFEYCSSLEWSSLSPDPKGTIGQLNETTGRLDRI